MFWSISFLVAFGDLYAKNSISLTEASVACFYDEVSLQKSTNKEIKIDSIYASFQRFIGASKLVSFTGNHSH